MEALYCAASISQVARYGGVGRGGSEYSQTLYSNRLEHVRAT